MTDPQLLLRREYLACLTMLGEVAPLLMSKVRQDDIAQAFANASVLIPGFEAKRIGKRWVMAMPKQSVPTEDGSWRPLEPVEPTPHTEDQIQALVNAGRKHGLSEEQVRAGLANSATQEMWANDLYTVIVKRGIDWMPGFPSMVHLSIRRNDRAWPRDWRHFQAIKNQLVGDECEGVELYPAESRLVDTSNQFHLFCISDPSAQFSFGFDHGREVDDEDHVGGARQRPREEPGQSKDSENSALSAQPEACNRPA